MNTGAFAIWAAFACGVVVYLVSRWALGRLADTLIGGCVIAGAVLQPWWLSASGYLAGHAIAALLVGQFIDHVRPRPLLIGALIIALGSPVVGFYTTMSGAISESNEITARALRKYESGTDVERFVPMPTELSWDDALRSAGTILYASAPGCRDASNFAIAMREALGPGADAGHACLSLSAWNEASLESAFGGLDAPDGTTDAAWFTALRDAGLAKRYFDFNYNVNAMAIFSGPLRALGVETNGYLLSKYSLQLLYLLRGKEEPFEEGQCIRAMLDWRGTGKYVHPADLPSWERPSLGSVDSYSRIIEGLVGRGLLARSVTTEPMSVDAKERWGRHRAGEPPRTVDRHWLAISDKGRALLDLLHPDCEDADLPFRLDAWFREGLSGSQARIDSYLRTFFGNQMQFRPRTGVVSMASS